MGSGASIDITEGGHGDVLVHGEATVPFARELHAALGRLVPPGGQPAAAVQVDVSGLEALDVAGAQVLIAWRRKVGAERVRFHSWPEPIAEFLRGCGLDRHLAP